MKSTKTLNKNQVDELQSQYFGTTVMRKDLTFDLEKAYNYQQQLQPEQNLYRPVYFANSFDSLLEREYVNVKAASFVDDQGNTWRMDPKFKVKTFDFSHFQHLEKEEEMWRRFTLLNKLKNQGQWKGFEKIYSHGWNNPNTLDYKLIVEQPYCDLFQLNEQQSNNFVPHGTAQLIATRVFCKVAESVELLW